MPAAFRELKGELSIVVRDEVLVDGSEFVFFVAKELEDIETFAAESSD